MEKHAYAMVQRLEALGFAVSVGQAVQPILDFTTSHGIAFAAYCPLGAHPMKPGAVLPEQSFHGLASQRLAGGWTPARVALRALLERAPNLIPIFGTSSAAHLEENLRALAQGREGPTVPSMG